MGFYNEQQILQSHHDLIHILPDTISFDVFQTVLFHQKPRRFKNAQESY